MEGVTFHLNSLTGQIRDMNKGKKSSEDARFSSSFILVLVYLQLEEEC
jgi:hypothetical protein